MSEIYIRKNRLPNRWGCKPTSGTCIEHGLTLECRHGCNRAKQHQCKEIPDQICTKCGSTFESGKCKTCHRAQIKNWHKLHPESARKTSLKYYYEHKAEVKEKKHIWYKENAELARKRSREFGKKYPEKKKAMIKKWLLDHPDAGRIYNQNRRERKRKNGGILSSDITDKLFKLQRGKCACCGKPLGKDYHLDHRMPLVLGGENTDSNMQLLRSRCNQEKHMKHPIEFMQSRGFLL